MKNKLRSFRVKLWLYFVLFTALIFTVLWLLQTVFIQSFYNEMLISNTKEAAAKIAASICDGDYSDTVDDLSLNNSILVYITDTDGDIIYSSDQFKRFSGKGPGRMNESIPDKDDGGSNPPPDSGRHFLEYRSLPENYSEFLSALSSSDSGVYESTTDGLYVYGTYAESEGEKIVLYISTTIDAIGPAVDIIRTQLIWVTVISLIVGFVLAWFIARGFSRPVAGLTGKAEHIGEDDFPEGFKKGFCSELDELSDVLDETSDKLKRSRAFQRELLANVSHDLRTPLTMIKGYAEMVRDISRTDEEQCAEDIGVIIREADRLSAMVNEILEYSEMQSDSVSLHREPVDLGSVTGRVCGNFESLYSRENGNIQKDIEDGVIISADESRIERAVYNLLDNALRHSGDDKTVSVSLRREGGKAVLRIADKGKGIPAGELENIWDRYYTYRQRDKKGVSGLGLAIVKQIVTMHGGSCSAESKEGEGSTFILSFDADPNL